ncbi:MAG: hypothetical protein ACFB5Z_16740 [Elainellaceae cyanobacterium]
MQSVTLQFITLQVPRSPTATLRERVEAALGQQGQPLRWAITGLEGSLEGDAAVIEAVIRV